MPNSSRMATQQGVELGALARIKPGRRLVEAQQHRVGAHGAGDFEPPLRAIGQVAGRVVGARGEPDAVEPGARLVDRRALGLRVRGKAEHAKERIAGGEHQPVVLRDQQIFQRRHAGKQPDVLERARDPRPLRDQIIRHALEQIKRAVLVRYASGAGGGESFEFVPYRAVAVAQRQPSGARLVEAGDAVEHRGLAGAVRPDQRGDGALADVEADIVDREEAAEPHGQMLDAEQSVGRDILFAHDLLRPSHFRAHALTVAFLDQVGGDALAFFEEHRRFAA